MMGCVLSQLKSSELYILSRGNNVELLGLYPIQKDTIILIPELVHNLASGSSCEFLSLFSLPCFITVVNILNENME